MVGVDDIRLNSNYQIVKFAVSDTGIGIKEENIAKLFKLFGKIEQENRNINPQGIGLGLTICNKILFQMGSKLDL